MTVAEKLRDHGALRFAQRVALKHGVSLEAVLGRRRYKTLIRARRELVAVVTWTLGLSQTESAELFGYKDHASIWLYCLQYERRLRAAR